MVERWRASHLKTEEIPLLVLAGGKATRLAHLASGTAKYLQPIKDSVVFADVHLRWVAKQGFRRVILSIGHLGEQIRDHCADGKRYGLEISYLEDGPKPIGTGAAVLAALENSSEVLAVTYGDTVLNFNVGGFLTEFELSQKVSGMTLYRNTLVGHVCNAELDGQLALYDKRQPGAQWTYIDYGFMIFKREARLAFGHEIPLDLADPLSQLSRKSQVFAFPVSHRFWEIGSLNSLEEFRKAFPDDIFGPVSL